MKKLVLLSVLIAFILAPAFVCLAADKKVDFYGRARVFTIVDKVSKEAASLNGVDNSDVDWIGGYNGRFGVNFDTGENVTGKVELGIGYQNNTAKKSTRVYDSSGTKLTDRVYDDMGWKNNAVTTRHVYGKWNFGMGSLIVGQTSGAADNYICMTDAWWAALGDSGDFDGVGRAPGLQLEFPVGGGTLQIGAFNNYTMDYTNDALALGLVGDVEKGLPRFEVGYAKTIGIFDFALVGDYQKVGYRGINSTAQEYSFDIDSNAFAGVFGVDLKPVYLKGQVWIGQNVPEAGFGGGDDAAIDFTADYTLLTGIKTYDTDYFGYGIKAQFTVNDKAKVNAGWIHVEADQDVETTKTEKSSDAFYIQAPITLAPNVLMCPEIARKNFGDTEVTSGGTITKTENGDETIYGIYWQITF
jgi:hypothetical protein